MYSGIYDFIEVIAEKVGIWFNFFLFIFLVITNGSKWFNELKSTYNQEIQATKRITKALFYFLGRTLLIISTIIIFVSLLSMFYNFLDTYFFPRSFYMVLMAFGLPFIFQMIIYIMLGFYVKIVNSGVSIKIIIISLATISCLIPTLLLKDMEVYRWYYTCFAVIFNYMLVYILWTNLGKEKPKLIL